MNINSILDGHKVLKEFFNNIAKNQNLEISRVIVFGSVAKGNAGAISDIDLLVLLKADKSLIREKIRSTAYNAMLSDNFSRLISLHFMEENHFNRLLSAGYSFEKQIEEEGIQLWKAA